MTRWWVIGAGRAGAGLGSALAAAGQQVTWVSRAPSARLCAVADASGARAVAWDAFEPSPDDCALMCVPDDAVPRAARALDALLGAAPSPRWLHTAGSLPPEQLQQAVRGPAGGAHPLFPFGPPFEATPSLHGSVMGIDGAPEAVEAAAVLARCVGAQAVHVPTGGRAAWHLSATLASNGVYALQEAARAILEHAGIDAAGVQPGLALLARTSADAVLRLGVESALTGPVARGDVSTVLRHRRWLHDASPEHVALYGELVQLLLHIAERRGLPAARLAAITHAIFAELPSGPD